MQSCEAVVIVVILRALVAAITTPASSIVNCLTQRVQRTCHTTCNKHHDRPNCVVGLMKNLCKGECCKGHNLSPLQRELFLEWTKEPAHRELRKLVLDLDSKGVNHDLLIEKTAEVYGKFQCDDKFRTSPTGRALYSKGPTIRLGADPRLFLNDANNKLKYVKLHTVFTRNAHTYLLLAWLRKAARLACPRDSLLSHVDVVFIDPKVQYDWEPCCTACGSTTCNLSSGWTATVKRVGSATGYLFIASRAMRHRNCPLTPGVHIQLLTQAMA